MKYSSKHVQCPCTCPNFIGMNVLRSKTKKQTTKKKALQYIFYQKLLLGKLSCSN